MAQTNGRTEDGSSPLLTIGDVARLCQVSERTAWAWTRDGLPIIRIGRLVRVQRADLDAFIASHRESLMPQG